MSTTSSLQKIVKQILVNQHLLVKGELPQIGKLLGQKKDAPA